MLTGIITFITGVFTGDWSKAWEGLKMIANGIATAIGSFFHGVLDGILGIVQNIIDTVASIKLPELPATDHTGRTIGTLPKMASGTDNWVGGLVQVSERGGEILDLPRGTRIYPHDKSVAMARAEGARSNSISVNVTGNSFTVREEADINKIGEAIARKLSMAASNRGGWTFSGNMA